MLRLMEEVTFVNWNMFAYSPPSQYQCGDVRGSDFRMSREDEDCSGSGCGESIGVKSQVFGEDRNVRNVDQEM